MVSLILNLLNCDRHILRDQYVEAGNTTEYMESFTVTGAHTNAKTRPKFTNKQVNVSYKSSEFFHKSHSAVNCTKFENHEARLDFVKRECLCFNCLGHHNLASCKSHKSCKKCKKRHHTSLCKDKDLQNA